MAGIFPSSASGGVTIRDAAGAPVAAPGVANAYVPPAEFLTPGCALTALPAPPDCSAKFDPSQINALVSELLALAVALDPDGPWTCASVQNVANAFAAWRDGTAPGSLADIIADETAALAASIASALASIATLTTSVAGKVAKAGDTMTGNLTMAGAHPRFTFNGPAAEYQGFEFRRNNVMRWQMYPSHADVEAGSNSGSSFSLLTYDDAGAFLGYALFIRRVNRFLAIGHGVADRMLHPELDDAVNNAVSQVARFTHTTSGAPANGIGAGMEFEVETAAGNNEIGATIEAIATDVTAAAEQFDLVLKAMRSGAAASEVLRLGATAKFSKPFYYPEQTLTDAANIDWAVGAAQCAKVTIAGNRTFNAPTGMIAGQFYFLRVIQDGTGSRLMTWNAAFSFGVTPTLKTAAGAVDTFLLYTDGTTLWAIHLNAAAGASTFSAAFTSSDQTITAAGSLTIAHGLGTAPTLVTARLKCTTAEYGHSVGDVVEVGVGSAYQGTDRGMSVIADATNVNIRFGASNPTVAHKTTGVQSSITPASWKLIIKAWR